MKMVFSAAFGLFSVALLRNCGRMGSGRESLPVTYHIALATVSGYKRNSNGVLFVEERLMKKLLYGGDGFFGTEYSVF